MSPGGPGAGAMLPDAPGPPVPVAVRSRPGRTPWSRAGRRGPGPDAVVPGRASRPQGGWARSARAPPTAHPRDVTTRLLAAVGVALAAAGLAVEAGAAVPDGAVSPAGVADADAPDPPPDDAAGSPARGIAYGLPVTGRVQRLFAAPATRWAAGHRGVDLEAAPGTPIRAPAEGVVAFSGLVVDRTVLTLRHPDGRRSSLEPLADVLPEGTAVAAGDVVGLVADVPRHCAPTPCVHWGVREGPDAYVDPLGLVDPGPVVLLP